MRFFLRIFVLAFLASFAAGCATVAGHRHSPSNTGPGGAGLQAPQAGQELDAGLVYQILLAEIAEQRHHYDVAAAHYLELARLTGSARFAQQATRTAVMSRNLRQARKAVAFWVSIKPEDVHAREIALSIYLRSGKLDKAAEQLDILLRLYSPEPDKGATMLAALLANQPDQQAALRLLESYTSTHTEKTDALYVYGYLSMRANHLKTARQAMDAVLKIRPQEMKAMLVKAQAMMLENDVDGAIAFLQKAVASLPKKEHLRQAYARALIRKGDFEDAFKQFQVAATLAPDNVETQMALGILSLELKRFDEAQEYLLPLSERDGVLYDASFYLGQIAEEKGNLDAATKWYMTVSQGQHYVDAQTRIAVLLAKQGDLDAARVQLHSIKGVSARDKVGLYLVEGDLLGDAGKWEQADAVFSAALEEFVDNTRLLYARAMAAEKLDRLDVLESDLRRVLELEPDNAHAWNALGYTLADRTDRYDEAAKYIRRALRLRPDDYFILDSYGWVQYRLGNYDTAVLYLRQAAEKSREDAEIAAHLGEVLWAMGRTDEANKVWQRALKKSPKSEALLSVIKRFTK